MTCPSLQESRAITATPPWMLYGAAGHTGTLIAQHARQRGHTPVLAGRNAPTIAALAERLDLSHRAFSLDDPSALRAALADIELVLNAAGPFVHTAAPLAEACLNAGVHYLDISNELQVFRALYGLHQRAEAADVAIIPGVGFGVIATNCLARSVSDAVGGPTRVEVATRMASAQPGPGAAATMRENLPYGGWVRQGGRLQPLQLGSGIATIMFPDGRHKAIPVPTGDLEAAFHATGAQDVIAYSVTVDPDTATPLPPQDPGGRRQTLRSYGWARATGADGATAEAWLQTGDSYLFTAAACTRAVEEALAGTARGALSPAVAFGADFPFTIEGTTRTDVVVRASDA
jgi:short subunit dehydrogenase-like uncharacterized protein